MMTRSILKIPVLGLVVAMSACGGSEVDRAGVLESSDRGLAGLQPVPGLVMGLLHNSNQAPAGTVMYSARTTDAGHYEGGDEGADNHRGYEWWALPDNSGGLPSSSFESLLPPGVVVGLRHSTHQSGLPIFVFGNSAVNGPASFPGFQRQSGGDLGASNGVGYYWYESTGRTFTDWAGIDALLPRYTVIGLKHSANQASKKLIWNGTVYDPVQPFPVPPGFRRMNGGDLGAPSGVGYYWYEKTTGQEIVSIPRMNVTLTRNLYVLPGESHGQLDQDGDHLVDTAENALAIAVRPWVQFDSHETARRNGEPVGIFRVTPLSRYKVRIRFVPLFLNDGGYGGILCDNSHPGDNDTIDYDLITLDGGTTWQIRKVELSFRGLNWPGNSRLEVFLDVDGSPHPKVYMSGSKHHEYLTRDNDQKDSLYSDWGCDDNVDGLGGAALLAIFGSVSSPVVLNVGEPGAHPSPTFVNALDPVFPGQTVWSGANFYSSETNRSKFKVILRDHDYDANGTSDIALVGGPGWTSVPVAFSNGSGFSVTNYAVTDFPTWAALPGVKSTTGDFDGDGLADIALVGGPGWYTLPVAFSNGNGTFYVSNSAVDSVPSWSQLNNVKTVSGDFNGDGFSDIALVGGAGWYTLPVAFSNGDGTFNVTNLSVTDFPYWAQVANVKAVSGDFNSDGFSDIALVGAAGWTSVPVAFSNGDGTFTVANNGLGNFPTWAAGTGVMPVSGDFDGDGLADIALTGGAGWTSMPVAYSNGNGTFRVTNGGVYENSTDPDGSPIVVQSFFPVFLAAPGAKVVNGDFNNDGLSDVAVVGGSGWSAVPIAYSSGNGQFSVSYYGAGSLFPGWATFSSPVK